MSRGVKVMAAVVIALVLVWGASHLRHRGTSRGQEDGSPIPVTVVPVKREDVPIYRIGKGTVTALNSVAVQPQVNQPLLSLHFKEGDEVKKGQLLALLDPRTYQAQLDQDLANQKHDEATLATNISTYRRNKGLLAKGYISALQMDTYANNVKQLTAQVAADQSKVQGDRVQLSYTQIYSPIDGVAGIRNVDPGNLLTTSTTLVTITQITPIYIKFPLPEADLEAVRMAAKDASLEVDALDSADNRLLADGGKLDVIDNQIDVSSGTFQLRAIFPNSQRELWPGQFVNARLKLRTVHDGLVIPAQAVQRGPDSDYVYWVKSDQSVAMQPVHVLSEVDDSHVMVDKGLSAGMQVVTEGQFRLKPGSKIEALKPGQMPADPTADVLKQAGAQRGRKH